MASSIRRKTAEALVPIYGVTLIDVLGTMIMVPLLPYLAQRFGASGFTVGLILTTSAVASVIAAPFWGAVSDRLGRKRIVLISQCVSLGGYLALATSHSLAMLFVARAIAGIGGGNLGVTQSYIADVTDEKTRDRAYALFGALFGVGIVLGPVLGGFLIRFGLSVPFIAAAAIELVTIGLTLRFLPDQRPKTRASARSELRTALRTVVRISEVRNVIVRHFLFIFAVTYFFTIFALYVKQQLHAGPEISSWLLASSGAVGGVALLLVAGPLTRRYGDATVAQAGLALSALAYIAIAFTPFLWAFGVALGVWAIGSSCVEPTLTALLSETAPEEERGAVMGLNDACNNLALIVGPPLGGYAIDLNPHLVGIIPACAVLVAFAVGLAPPRKDHAPALRERTA